MSATATPTATYADVAEFVATEVAWRGSASDAWIADRVAAAGYVADAPSIVAFAVKVGLLKPIPRLGGYAVSRRVNARVFGEDYAAAMEA